MRLNHRGAVGFSITIMLFVGSVLAPPIACAQPAVKPRVIILGFDGMKPAIVEKMMKEGQLPNFEALRKEGTYERLGTTYPPQSPTAWASFSTCVNSGTHGIFDFIRRDPKTYLPDVGFGITEAPKIAPDGSVIALPKSITYCHGETFWQVADKAGVRCKILHIPFAYPPNPLEEGEELCGEGVPDIRGATTTFYSLSDMFTPEQLAQRVAGGERLALHFKGDTATVEIPGYRDPLHQGQFIKVPLTVTVDRKAHKLTVSVQGQSDTVPENGWSKWLRWTFKATPQYTVHAISNFCVLEAGQHVRLYMSSLQFDPKKPYIRFSTPPSYAGQIEDRMGLYKTIGWSHDTHALQEDALTDDAFLHDVKATDEWMLALTMDEIKRDDFQLLVSCWTSTDRVAHLFWRFRDPKSPLYTVAGAKKYGHAVEDTYKRMDQIVGKVRKALRPTDIIMILSDHGFHSFRTGFSINTWLVRNGYLALRGKPDAATAHTDPGQEFLLGNYIDWSKTKVYGLGLSSLYLNLKGREGQGIVDPADAKALIAELKRKLLKVRDPKTGALVFGAIYTKANYPGPQDVNAPDIELGYNDGYQTAKGSAAGAVPKHVFSPNLDKWSGEHAGSVVSETRGIFFSNRHARKGARIEDLGVTALHCLGVPIPKSFQGKPLF